MNKQARIGLIGILILMGIVVAGIFIYGEQQRINDLNNPPI
jgi:hypothetical protein